jgi:hypothetical protein
MCALSMNGELLDKNEMEWWMHYQIPWETLHLYFPNDLEVKKSEIPLSTSYPYLNPGKGLFTTKDRKMDEYLCSFPGYWLHSDLQEEAVAAAKGDSYAFTPPKDNDDAWPDGLLNLVYMSHRCKANKINAGKMGDEVQSQNYFMHYIAHTRALQLQT